MNTAWQCAVCEAVNYVGRECTACGATLTRRSTVATSVRGRLTPTPPPPPPPAPLPRPVERAINREPVPAEEWEEIETGYSVVPIPGGCLVSMGPRQRW